MGWRSISWINQKRQIDMTSTQNAREYSQVGKHKH